MGYILFPDFSFFLLNGKMKKFLFVKHGISLDGDKIRCDEMQIAQLII